MDTVEAGLRVTTGTRVAGYSIDGDDDRVNLIRQQILESVKDPLVIWVARAITAGCQGRDEQCELQAVYHAVKHGPIPLPADGGGAVAAPGLRFVNDPRYVDTYPTAGKILRWLADGAAGEDCDGHVILVNALLNALGWQTGAVIASRDGREFIHIFPVVGVNSKDAPSEWMPLDTTVAQARPGWWPPRSMVRRMRVYAFLPDIPARGRELRV